MSERTYEEIETENEKLRQDNAELSARVKQNKIPYPTNSTTDISQYFSGRELTIGVVSDSHLGSIHARPDILSHMYEIFKEKGISTVLHTGDMVAGVSVYPGQVHELTHHTYEAQKNHAIKKYPLVEGIR